MAQEWRAFRARKLLSSWWAQLEKMRSVAWNELFLLIPFEDGVMCIWYPKSSVEGRFRFRVKVCPSFREQTEEPGVARPEHTDPHANQAPKEGPTVLVGRTG